MELTLEDVGKTFKLKGRTGGVQLLTLSADKKTAYVDTQPDAAGKFRGRYQDVPVEQLMPLSPNVKGAPR